MLLQSAVSPAPLYERSIERNATNFIECISLDEIREFTRARDLLPQHLIGFIHAYSAEEYVAAAARVFLTQNLRAGYALIGCELVSVFSLPGASMGDFIVAHAVQYGADNLDCFDAVPLSTAGRESLHGHLYMLYSRHGFVETRRVSWNEAYAPPNWDYALWGRPDQVFMKLNGAHTV